MDNNKVPKDMLPTLIIGLGGTGYQVIKRVKQIFRKRYGKSRLPVRYLLIDTDLKSFLDDGLDNNEKCQLRFGDGIKNTLDWAYNNPNFDWLPQNPKITPDFFTSTDQGAGLMRPIGRLYMCKNAKLVYDILSSAKNDLVDLHKVLTDLGDAYLENIDRHKVYIVGSLAGGTGCGTFLDVAVMLSNIFNRDTTNIIGMFTLESCYDDKLSSDVDSQSRSKANCYAALKELEFYMSSVSNPEDKKYTFKYTNIGELKLQKKLLDVCYLIENRNEMGGVLTNLEDIYDLCSLQLFQEVGTALGSQLRADYANFICKDRDPVLKKDRHFSTFSSSSMEFPVESLKHYCSSRLAYDILERLGRENIADVDALEEESSKLLDKINNDIEFNIYIRDFVNNLKISSQILYEDLNGSRKGNLDKVGKSAEQKRQQWYENKSKSANKIHKNIEEFFEHAITSQGIGFAVEVLNRMESRLYNEVSDSTVTSNIDKEKIKANINNITDRRILKGKEPMDSATVSLFNSYLDQEQKRFRYFIHQERYEIIKENIQAFNEKVSLLLTAVGDMKIEVCRRLDKIIYQSQKKYGGNIISREMVIDGFYDEYYSEKFAANIESRIVGMLRNMDLTAGIKSGPEVLIKICEEEVERLGIEPTIMDILSRNARNEGLSINEYVKNELDTTARLAKPFWSAVKNPEVAWTECYYIGSIKDEDINNGFTTRAPEPIDKWIRNQTGERSRQARFVETKNPFAIDVIHITMGACAAYLPDIKHYKQFYLKLIASKAYPLHLDERYIGLQELDLDTDKMLEYYSLAKAYGVILELEKSFFLNLRRTEEGFRYIYYSDNCLKSLDYAIDHLAKIPEKKSRLPEGVVLGDSYTEIIQNINEDTQLSGLLKDFIEDAERRFSKDELKEHYLNYIKGRVTADFIAREKITHRIAAN